MSKKGSENLAKRVQVSKACTNCRKAHSGCDNDRPCRRCVQHGLENSCIDVPRKKRTPKQAKEVTITEISSHSSNSSSDLSEKSAPNTNTSPKQTRAVLKPDTSLLPNDPFLRSDPSPLRLETQSNLPFFQTNVPFQPTTPFLQTKLSFSQPNSLPMNLQPDPQSNLSLFQTNVPFQQTTPFMYPDPSFIQPNSLQMNLQPNTSPILLNFSGTTLQSLAPSYSTSSSFQTNNLGEFRNQQSANEEIDLLMEKAMELEEKNKALESQLASLTGELSLLRESQRDADFSRNQLGPQVKQSQHNLAVSIWKETNEEHNYELIECNSSFLELVGYSEQDLRKHFTSKQLFQAFDGPSASPKRMKVNTAHGLKEVVTMINSIQETSSRYIIIQMLESIDTS